MRFCGQQADVSFSTEGGKNYMDLPNNIPNKIVFKVKDSFMIFFCRPVKKYLRPLKELGYFG